MTERIVTLRWARASDDPTLQQRMLAELPPAERRRVAEFRNDSARRSHLLGRIMRRRILASVLGVPAGELDFTQDPHGKPTLRRAADAGIGFNLSHSRDLVGFAWGRTDRLGLDVEVFRPMTSAERLAHRFFSPAEQSTILSLSGTARARHLLTLWTRKEAWLKATGRGVSVRLAAVEVEADPRRPARLLGLPEGCGDPGDWSLLATEVAEEAACTVCVPAGDWSVDPSAWSY